MADQFVLTPNPVRVTGVTSQNVVDALDVSDYDEIEAILGGVGFEGAGAVTVRLMTGMQNSVTDGWVALATFTNLTGANQYFKLTATGLLKYIRWEVSQVTSTAATFTVSGMLRSRDA